MSADIPSLDVTALRAQFPAFHQTIDGKTPIFLDNPAGTQVPQCVIDAILEYFVKYNANVGGAFPTSVRTEEIIEEARQAMADLLNAPSRSQIAFGDSMTSLTFAVSRAIGRTLSAGDEIIVTRIDHDANISPWLLLARDYDLTVRFAPFDVETGRLDYDALAGLITDRTRVMAFSYASNALGTINDVTRVVELAREAGALSYVDAVQYAPHGPIDVSALDPDFLVCSAYKFFGPHMGVLYGRASLLESLPAYKVRPASNKSPNRWETGTSQHELLAGLAEAIGYLAAIGGEAPDRRTALRQAMAAIKQHEQTLSWQLIEGLSSIPQVVMAGITDRDSMGDRVPTVIFNVDGISPDDVAAQLAADGIYVWSGNYYALEVMESLGQEQTGGMVRVGAVHYNTPDEIDKFLSSIKRIAGG